ncbi:CPBP family intramembrane glutamic endopeptidase [Amycolatopsis sp. NPDC059027]|uniref:CPBP family intramembrane glutamic endopeptidase n=1 Tax=unclassified Amycolatopsis TaxID=2618356 RepID=UPI00366F96B1
MDGPEGARRRAGLVLGAHWGFLAFFAGIAGYHVVNLAITVVMNRHLGEFDPLELHDIGPLLLLAFLPNLLLGLGPVAGSRIWGAGLREDFGLLPTWRDVRIGLACGVLALVAGFGLNLLSIAVYGTGDSTDVSDSPLTDLADTYRGDTVWLVLAAVIVVAGAPVTEELLVRGTLWNGLSCYRIPRWVVLVLTALVFAQLHGEPARVLALFGQGLAIGLARYLSGRVGAAVVAHAANNLPPAVFLFVGTGGLPLALH